MTLRKTPLPFLAALLMLPLGGCFTGIESTRPVSLTKQEKHDVAPSEEQLLMARISPSRLSDWPIGKAFIVADSRLSLLMAHGCPPGKGGEGVSSQEEDGTDIASGDTLLYSGTTELAMPDNSIHTALLFKTTDGRLLMMDSKRGWGESKDVRSDQLPLLYDLEMVREADSLLTGRTLWARSPLAYSPDGERLTVRKFQPLVVSGVSAGDNRFPLRVKATDASGMRLEYFLDFNDSSSESRPLEKIFLLTDPRKRHAGISEENWQAICNNTVLAGMTKEECRLALGNPSDADVGRNYSSTIELWQYPDGTYLKFVDGLLSSFRK